MEQDDKNLRLLGRLEGLSYLLLLGIAMPMKYMMGIPMATKVVGWPHGVLFMLYVVVALRFARKYELSASLTAGLLVGALLPFGPFVAERFLPRPQV